MKTHVKLIHLNQVPVFEQLKLEEALLRADNDNWCILNSGSPPAIVLGISGNPAELIHEEQRKKHQIPLIRRFSGGGTVVIDQTTCFVTFIFNKESLGISPYPIQIMEWTESFYKPFLGLHGFKLQENDYVIENKKCGGNAQCLIKGRWLHHTTFLWDYQPEFMDCLALPQKMPLYRQQRSHENFICRLKDYFTGQESAKFLEHVKERLEQLFLMEEVDSGKREEFLLKPHRQSTICLSNLNSHNTCGIM